MKATHSGTCQLCGRLQKMPDGKMAKHGYTVQWGFFEGTCPGSDHLPYELAKDLIDARIEWADTYALDLREKAMEVESNREMLWVHESVAAKFSGGRRVSGYSFWRSLPRAEVTITKGYNTVANWVGKDGGKRQQTVSDPEALYWTGDIDEARAVTLMNRRYARKLRDDAIKVDGYREWLKKRVAEWAPQPHKLVAEKQDKPARLIHWAGGHWRHGKACAASYMGASKGIASPIVSEVNCPKCLAIINRRKEIA